ncbi:MAG: alginate export family protein [Candidatus Omnitrophica bacterium]|nr:alginate export family protein [Candidatus Omnitrophota bacterium]
MKKFIVLTLALIWAATAVPAFASVQNVRVGGWTKSTFLHRQEFDLGRGSGGVDKQDVFINQTHLQVDADLTDQVYVTIALIGERGWGNDGGDSDSTSEVDLHLAYVTLKEMLYSPLTLVVGRQTFAFGNGFVFDATGTNNTAPTDSGIANIAQDLTQQTALDAIRAIFDYNPLTVTVFYSKLHQNTVDINHVDDDKDLYGINANYQLGDDMNSVAEAYFFKQRDKSVNVAATGSKTDHIKVTGVRASTNPIEGLNLQGEVAHQGGSKRGTSATQNTKRNAWGAQGIMSYQLPGLEEYKPVAQYIFTKVTGDTDTGASESKYTGWDPFFENQGGGHIYNSLFDLTNSVIHSFYLTAEPVEDITTRLAFTAIWLERELKQDSFSGRSPDGTTNSYDAKTDSTFLGKEVDLDTTYNYTEDVTFGTSIGVFFPKSVFDNENNSTAKQALVSMNVAF